MIRRSQLIMKTVHQLLSISVPQLAMLTAGWNNYRIVMENFTQSVIQNTHIKKVNGKIIEEGLRLVLQESLKVHGIWPAVPGFIPEVLEWHQIDALKCGILQREILHVTTVF